MLLQRVQKPKPKSFRTSSKPSSQFAPRSFAVQESEDPEASADLGSPDFDQDRLEATGLQLKETQGTITPVEQERLGTLQAKIDGIWAQRMERAQAQPSFLDILSRGTQSAQPSQSGAPVQAKLTIGQPNDQYEQEADQVAAQVMRMPDTDDEEDPDLQMQPATAPVEDSDEDTLHRQAIADTITPLVQRQTIDESSEDDELQARLQGKTAQASAVDSNFESQLSGQRGNGRPLPKPLKSSFENKFQTSFDHVRVHTDTASVQMSQAIGAQAFTHGNDIYFNSGKYNPGSNSGQELLAHELTHVVQQTNVDVQTYRAKISQQDQTYWDWYHGTTGKLYQVYREKLELLGYEFRQHIAIGQSADGSNIWKEGLPKKETLAHEVAWRIILPSHRGDEKAWASIDSINDKCQVWLGNETSSSESDQIPYNHQVENGNIIDPDTANLRDDVIAPKDQWHAKKILHRLSQVDTASITVFDTSRCIPHSVLAVHIQAGAEAIRRVAHETLYRLHSLKKDHQSLRIIHQIKSHLSSALNNKKTENFTYIDLCVLAEGIYLIADIREIHENTDESGTNPENISKIDDLGHSEVANILQDEIEGGEVTPGFDQVIREAFGSDREPRKRKGRDAVSNLPDLGSKYTNSKTLHSLAKQLQAYRNVGLILSMPFANHPDHSEKGRHGFTLGVDGQGQVYLYDPSPRSGSQILFYPRQAREMGQYFKVEVIVEGKVAAATPNAHSPAF